MTHNVEDVYGLSPLQFGMLFHSLEDTSDTRPYTVQIAEEITGPFDEECMRDAWQRLVDRHTILRSAFVWEGVSEPLQVVQRTAELPFALRDLRGLGEADQEAGMREFLAEDWDRGFDLSQAPLVRIAVLRMTDERRVLVWSFHHILLDGWSIQFLQKELFALYRERLEGVAANLPEPLPYRRYIEWLGTRRPADSKAFWTRYLEGVTEPTDLHVDRDTGLTGIGELEIFSDPALFTRAREYARSQRITMNTLVQGVWSVLLSRYSGAEDVIFGSTNSGRSIGMPGIDTMVGLFINTLPVRGRVRGTAPAAQWLRDLQDEQLDMRQWEYCHLVDVREFSEVPRGEPLFRSIMVFENYPVTVGESDLPQGMDRRIVHAVERTGFPLTLVATARHVFEFKFVWDRALFDDAVIERMAGHVETLLASIVDNPGALLSELEMLTPAEREQWVTGVNATEGPYPDTATIHRMIEDRVATCPDAIAVEHGETTLTYRRLDEKANQLAHHLRHQGVQPDQLVAVCLDRGPELVATLLGIMKAGAAFVPLDPEYPTDRITFMIDDTATPLVITQTTHADRLPADVPKLLTDTHWPQGPTTTPEPLATPDHLAYVIYTSGSTGRPKGVLLDHRGVVNYLDWCDRNYPPNSDNGVGTLLYSSVTFDLTITALFLPLIQGQRLAIPVSGPDRTAFDAAIDMVMTGMDIGFLKATPSHLDVLTAQLEAAGVRHGIATIVAGGEDLSPALADRVFRTGRHETVISNEYGATEGSVANVMALTTAKDHPATGSSPVGVPITNTTAYVVDRYDRPVPVGVPGECLLGGICVARGYLNRPELTETRFVPDPFSTVPGARAYRTGDLVRWREDGAMEFIGRIDNQVKLRGYRIELGEIENTLLTHPGLVAATVTVHTDATGDKMLVGHVVPAGTTAPSAADLRAHLLRDLPDYMAPTVYVPLERMPLTPNGKVDTKALPAPDGHRPDLAAAYTAPRTPAESAIAAIWSDILGIDTVGVHDNFFELGGQSIKAVRIASRVGEAGWPATVQQVMRHTTIATLAAAVAGPPATTTAGLVVPLGAADGTGLPKLFCVHPGGGSTHSYRQLAERLAGRFEVYGVQAAGLNPGEEPLLGVDTMAARYWQEVRSVQPRGPVLLLGWSTGAVVAQEMAAQRPAEIAAVHLLEPAVTGPEREAWFLGHAEVYRRAEELWRRGRAESGAAREATAAALRALAPRLNIDEGSVCLDEWLPYAVLEAEVRSLAAHRPRASAAPTTLYVSATVRDALPGDPDEVPLAPYAAHWHAAHPRGLDLVDLPGGHLRMVKETGQLDVLTARLTEAALVRA